MWAVSPIDSQHHSLPSLINRELKYHWPPWSPNNAHNSGSSSVHPSAPLLQTQQLQGRGFWESTVFIIESISLKCLAFCRQKSVWQTVACTWPSTWERQQVSLTEAGKIKDVQQPKNSVDLRYTHTHFPSKALSNLGPLLHQTAHTPSLNNIRCHSDLQIPSNPQKCPFVDKHTLQCVLEPETVS